MKKLEETFFPARPGEVNSGHNRSVQECKERSGRWRNKIGMGGRQ